LLACVGLVLVFFVFNKSNPVPDNPISPQPVITQPVAPVVTMQPAMKTPRSGQTALPGFNPNGVFMDDFSNHDSGWGKNRSDDYILAYENGGYRIWVNKSEYIYWSTLAKSLPGDLAIEVDATKTGGPDENGLGVLCRYQDENNFYMFVIRTDGYVLISKEVGGEDVGLSSEQLQPSDAVHQGSASNHI
jgi:hypothetical protein